MTVVLSFGFEFWRHMDLCPHCTYGVRLCKVGAQLLEESAELAAEQICPIPQADAHVVPDDEEGDHELTTACPCEPRVDDGVPSGNGRIWIHKRRAA